MKKQILLLVWFLMLIVAGIILYPYAYKSFVEPSLTVYVIDPSTQRPIQEGDVKLYTSDSSNKSQGDFLKTLTLDKCGKVTFKQLPVNLLEVRYFPLNGESVNITGISIGRHSGNVKLYLYSSGYSIAGISINEVSSNTTVSPDKNTISDVEYAKDYIVLYNDMRLRDQPSLDGKLLVTLNKHDKVSYLGERSSNKSLITIEGQPLLSAWMKVTTNTGISGWIIGTAVEEYIDN